MSDKRHYHAGMPRQNTCPADCAPFVQEQITQIAQRIAATRKQRGETQAHWAKQLGISQPTMARLERGDPAIATATYVMCLWLMNPQLDLLSLLPEPNAQQTTTPPPMPRACVTAAPSATNPADEFAALLAQWKTPAL